MHVVFAFLLSTEVLLGGRRLPSKQWVRDSASFFFFFLLLFGISSIFNMVPYRFKNQAKDGNSMKNSIASVYGGDLEWHVYLLLKFHWLKIIYMNYISIKLIFFKWRKRIWRMWCYENKESYSRREKGLTVPYIAGRLRKMKPKNNVQG